MTSRHPELAAEQQYLETAYDAHADTIQHQRDIIDGGSNGGADSAAQRAVRKTAIEKLERLLGVDTSRLIFGRLDFEEGHRPNRLYVGPCTIQDGNSKLKVVDFTNAKAKPFYTADDSDPLGLVRRRSFDLLERELRDISDEVFGDGFEEPQGARRTALDRVAEELERAREPRMQAIVASIVADQYRLIEAGHEGLFIVQGGPGTGKTAVALHRAVFLIRNNEDLGKVLVVGPNAAFMAYIAGVLPGLGESAVDQISIERLPQTGEAVARGSDEPALAALKGDPRMAEVIRNATRLRVRPAGESFSLSTQGVTVRLDADASTTLLDDEVARDRPYMEGRRRFVDSMRSAIESLLHERFARGPRRRSVDVESLRRYLNSDRSWNNFLERMWPTASAAQIVHELFTVEQRLRAAGENLLTDAEISALIRRGVRTVGVHPWTSDDMPLIDEAQAVMQGLSSQYGYVIVDEAQDLTPMQLRMIARRSRVGDVTLVGDIAQATGPTRYSDWNEIAAYLPTERGIRQDQLTIGYRVPRSIMELANLVLPMIAPTLPLTEPVREARIDPVFERVDELGLADVVASTVADLTADDRSIGVIAPRALLVAVRGALAAEGIVAGDISTDQLEKRVTLLSSSDAKGLEFDRVVLAEPWDIVTESEAGWSELYVALSRATQQLVVVHSRPLPAPLPGGEPVPVAAPPSLDDAPAGLDADDDSGDAAIDLALELDLDLDPGVTAPPEPEVEAEAADADFVSDDDVDEPEPDAPAKTSLRISDRHRWIKTPEAESEAGLVDDQPVAPPSAREPSVPVRPPAGLDAAIRQRTAPVRVAKPTRTDAIALGGSFSEAVLYTKILHDGRTRRGTAVPYVSHLLATAALVLEDGGTEAEAIAALLHDVVEDRTVATAEAIRTQFGDEVAEIVIGCTDPDVEGGFRAAKVAHIDALEAGSTSVRRVALAEKLDNARALLRDLERYGSDTWKRMAVDRDEMLWYLNSLVDLFNRTFPSVLAVELGRVVGQIRQEVASPTPVTKA